MILFRKCMVTTVWQVEGFFLKYSLYIHHICHEWCMLGCNLTQTTQSITFLRFNLKPEQTSHQEFFCIQPICWKHVSTHSSETFKSGHNCKSVKDRCLLFLLLELNDPFTYSIIIQFLCGIHVNSTHNWALLIFSIVRWLNVYYSSMKIWFSLQAHSSATSN